MRAHSRDEGFTRILYIDDDTEYALLLKSALEHLGYAVTTYWDPKVALKDLSGQAEDWDLVISDYDMPGTNGFDVARTVRKRHRKLPCAVISSHLTDIMVRDAPASGVGFLSLKPVVPEEFSELVKSALHGSRR